MLYTSYFARAGTEPKAVAISRGIPRFYTGKTYPKLAPSWSLIKENDPKVYATAYNKLLSRLDPLAVAEDLGDGAIMLCFEKEDEFCHRRLVANWLRSAGIEVEELPTRQRQLFEV